MNKHKKNNIKRIFLIIIISLISILFLILGFNNYKTKKFSYNENNSINYKVYLKENDFFEKKYLEENRTYITSLIDYIDIDFNYQVNFSEPVNMEAKYYLIATISANKTNEGGTFWSKKYNLTDEINELYKNQKQININQNIKIDYNTYNEILENFKRTYKLSTDGLLNVALIVESNSKSNIFTDDIKIESQIDLSIPLLQQSVEVAINKTTNNNNKTINIKKQEKKIKYLIFKIIGLLLMIINIIISIIFIKINKKYRKKHLYEIKLKKILSSYDSIIVTLDEMPNIENLSKIRVKTFNELIDVYNEVRMPINYYEQEQKSYFFIINESIIWTYTLDIINMGG